MNGFKNMQLQTAMAIGSASVSQVLFGAGLWCPSKTLVVSTLLCRDHEQTVGGVSSFLFGTGIFWWEDARLKARIRYPIIHGLKNVQMILPSAFFVGRFASSPTHLGSAAQKFVNAIPLIPKNGSGEPKEWTIDFKSEQIRTVKQSMVLWCFMIFHDVLWFLKCHS